MRIAILTSGYAPVLDGVAVSVETRVQRLAAGGHEVLLMAPRPADAMGPPAGLPGDVAFAGLPAARFGEAAGDLNPLPSARPVIDAALERFAPDLLHVDEAERLAWGMRCIPGLGFARRRGIPAVAFFHTNFIDYPGQSTPALLPWLAPVRAAGLGLLSQLYNRYDATLVPSTATLRRLRRTGLANGVAGAFNGADTACFSPALRTPGYWGARWGLRELDRRRVLLIAGRLTADKGWAGWRRALPLLAGRLRRDLGVVIAGDGGLRDEVAALARGLPNVHLIGGVPHGALGPVFANADLFATFSRCENASLAVYEALAACLPVIAPRAAGIPGQVRDGENGLLFPPGDAPAFAAAVSRLLDTPELAAALVRHLKAERASVDWDRAFAAWLDAVSAIAGGRARRPPR
ncbi:glycosyltransferase [Xanthobacter sp. V3C-3]|uniref:glycosyltransferase n=1 Tax=Xanthobacter lutulentifluminis TaxID=3119935 RepID=UPI00372774D8